MPARTGAVSIHIWCLAHVNQAAQGVEERISRTRNCEVSADTVFAGMKVNIYHINNHSLTPTPTLGNPCDQTPVMSKPNEGASFAPPREVPMDAAHNDN